MKSDNKWSFISLSAQIITKVTKLLTIPLKQAHYPQKLTVWWISLLQKSFFRQIMVCVCVCVSAVYKALAGRWCLIFSGHLDWLSLASFKHPHTNTWCSAPWFSSLRCVWKGSGRGDIPWKQLIKRSRPPNLRQKAADCLCVLICLCKMKPFVILAFGLRLDGYLFAVVILLCVCVLRGWQEVCAPRPKHRKWKPLPHPRWPEWILMDTEMGERGNIDL